MDAKKTYQKLITNYQLKLKRRMSEEQREMESDLKELDRTPRKRRSCPDPVDDDCIILTPPPAKRKETEEYRISSPKFPNYLEGMTQTISCPGCGLEFKGLKSVLYKEPLYFEHCIEKCKYYASLNLIRKCVDCKLLFLNEEFYQIHLKESHQNGRNGRKRVSIRLSMTEDD